MKTKTLFVLSLCLILFAACKKDSLVTTITEGQPPAPKIIVEATIRGLVLDRQGQPMGAASVTWGNQQVETDEDGIFTIQDLVNGEQAVLKVSKAGYFDAFQTILPMTATVNKTKIQLTPRVLSTSFTAQQGGRLQLPNGSEVDFAAAAFTDAQGNAYNGQVNVFATYIDPTDPELHEIMPGNLQALNAEGQDQTLQSFGMINVELEGNDGAPLQISSPAQLTMPVPASLLNQAPSSLPLWHFDKPSGLWLEEGQADLLNGAYVGAVSHFSFWNCDVPYDLVELSGTFLAEKFEIAGQVRVTASALDMQGLVNLSSEGSFRGKVIKGTPLLLELIDPNCNEVIYSVDLGSLNEDRDLGTINVPLNDDWVTVSGSLVNCDMETITDGVAVIRTAGKSYLISPKPDGSILGAFRACDETGFTVMGVDWETQVRGGEVPYSVGANVNLGTIQACGTSFTAEMRILIPNEDDYVVNNLQVSLQPSDSLLALYEFIVTDDQGAGNAIVYTFNIVNWTNDPANPVWGMGYQRQPQGTPAPFYQFSGDQEVVALQLGDEPGQAVYFRVDNVRLIDEISGETTENCVLELAGILQ